MSEPGTGSSRHRPAGPADSRQRGRDKLERPAFGTHAEEDLGQATDDHDAGADKVSDEQPTMAVDKATVDVRP